MKFTLEIEMGNDTMLTPEDLGDALAAVGDTVTMTTVQGREDEGTILDFYGNTVGSWKLA